MLEFDINSSGLKPNIQFNEFQQKNNKKIIMMNTPKYLLQNVEKYGNELFLQLREAVLQELAPDAQTEGLIEGVGNGGMDDDINGIIGDKEKIAVSQDEFIIPADVVSMLGDGSSQAGSEELYGMMDRVRQTKTGTTEQAPRLANKGGLLPA